MIRGSLQIAGHHARAAHGNLAGRARWQRLARRVDDAQIELRRRAAGRAHQGVRRVGCLGIGDHAGRFGQAVAVHGDGGQGRDTAHGGRRRRRAGHNRHAQRREVVLAYVGEQEFQNPHSRHLAEDRHPFLGHQGQRLRGLKTLQHDQGGAGQQGAYGNQRRAADVIHGQVQHQAVTVAKSQVTHLRVDVADDIGVAEARALGRPGSPAGENDQRVIAGLHLRLARGQGRGLG